MIFINEIEFKPSHFPDGTQMLLDVPIPSTGDKIVPIRWKYESDEELVTLIYLANFYEEKEYETWLIMGYIPNARMDRVKKTSEVFTLKYFCKVINSLHFKKVFVMDPHSPVSEALIDNVVMLTVVPKIKQVINTILSENNIADDNFVLCFPDAGAMKRYGEIVENYNFLHGEKKRNWDTGKIEGIDLILDKCETVKGKTVLMVDDIISYGGTLAYTADKLKESGALKIYAYATHVENSIDSENGTLKKRLESGIVEKVFTTDSLYSGNNKKIKIL